MLRNISAHNNCLLNNIIRDIKSKNDKENNKDDNKKKKGIKQITPSYCLKNYLAQDKTFSSNILNKLEIPVIHDFAAMLYALMYFNKSKSIIDYTYNELDLFVNRINKHIDYFDKNLEIKNNLLFFKKLVDFFKQKTYNTIIEQKS